jgi:exonuclease SbcD
MKALHTADWHIGKQLHSKKRYDEFEKFLNWLVELIKGNNFDILLIAGDIFDSSTPSNRAQELYNNFLASVAMTNCRHVVVIGGNHDAPSLLNAQRNIFKLLEIHVVGCAEEAPEDEVLLLHDPTGKAEMIVCAVPYLRDRDVRKAEAGETLDEKAQKLLEAIRQHYEKVCCSALKLQESFEHHVPIVAMGHLFAAGGKAAEGDGMRDLYVGTLGHVHADLFPRCIDYLALGHLHSAQTVAGNEHMRYSGAPLPMSFNEADQTKSVTSIEFKADKDISIEEIAIPTFKALKRIHGDWDAIFSQIDMHKDSEALVEVVYTGAEQIDYALKDKLETLVLGTSLEILKIDNKRKRDRILAEGEQSASLDDLKPIDVFMSVLQSNQIHENEQAALVGRFQEMLTSVLEGSCS